ncbi:hypothetical protein SARC_10050 [Sphaeroforma arctica JP610]|uniref:PAZ domain-containing protein n=1 Tax=Sphaeroforma arctica JP610 TaxID=667725 RepID=A0A0L0FL24_9EUKA|nr:hypothetical protein SARC_10050 [Sphaeroforma arctica JP610]KNC77487.1 hypothetical protein SARC_10050 [Sphaeroforma arctica JP610]|eukprot:XP_014151389.1 hypothetical protein SARC_10050 [Sphaeroforma arctica JP610]
MHFIHLGRGRGDRGRADSDMRSLVANGLARVQTEYMASVIEAIRSEVSPNMYAPPAPSQGACRVAVPMAKINPDIKVTSNVFPLKVKDGKQVYQNAVHMFTRYKDSDEEREKRTDLTTRESTELNRQILDKVKAHDPYLPAGVYDGRTTYWSIAEIEYYEMTVDHPNKRAGTTKVRVVIKSTGQKIKFPLTMDRPMHASVGEQALSLMVREPMAELARADKNKFIHQGVNLLIPDWTNQRHLGGGYFGLPGVSATIRMCQLGPSLAIDAAVAASPRPGPVLDYLVHACNVMDVPALAHRLHRGSGEWRLADNAIKGLTFKTSHLGYSRSYKAKGLGKTSEEHTFDWEKPNGEVVQVSIAEYFFEHHKIRLKYPQLPAITSGTSKHPILTPIEVTRIPEGQIRRKLDSNQTAAILPMAAVSAADRFDRINTSSRPLLKQIHQSVRV